MQASSTMKPETEQGDAPEQTRAGHFFQPSVDILEQRDELLVLADLPGADPNRIDIHFEDGRLRIHAATPPRNDGIDFVVHEYGIGDFFRTFAVAETIDSSKITAEYANGVLMLHLPKAEALRPRKISVKS